MHKLTFNTHRYFLIVLFLAVSACSSIQPRQSPNSLDAKINQTRIVLVGETHTDFGHHLNQLEIIQKAFKKSGDTKSGVLSIGLEMIQQPFQPYLDDYIAGNYY